MIRWVLIVLATARATRFVTSDWLGEWVLDRPARRWANRHDNPVPANAQVTGDGERLWLEQDVDPDNGWRSKMIKGLDCPFCIGFWLGAAILLGDVVCTRLGPIPRGIWRFGLATLGLNYVVGHLSAQIDS